jgi:hypothetical protein
VKRLGWVQARVTAALLCALGCQSIAGVEDVSFAPADSGACASYCSTLMEACPGSVAVYEDNETCSKVCGFFKAGTKPTGNTLACRSDQADVALSLSSDLSENSTNCAAAGPGGGDKCTAHPMLPDCEGYCTVYMKACPTAKDWGFDTFEQCTSRCAAFPSTNHTYTAADGHDGDTLACRLYHATLATVDPDNNCPSAALRPTGDCVGSGEPSCVDYCRLNLVACTGEYQAYESSRQCRAVCDVLKKGDRADTGGQDTVGCRAYHSYVALMGEPTPHCSHSGPAGDGICSDDGDHHPNCTAFCLLLAKGCPATFNSLYANKDAACVDECEMLDDAKVVGGNLYSIPRAQMGNTLKCRTLNAVRALTDPESADAPGFCAAATGEAPCN